MQITEIYKKFEVPPNLQQHMLRVTALAKIIIDSWKGSEKPDKEIIITSCLLHDLGNIIKFDFDNFPELLGDEVVNIEHWKDVKKKMIEKYGEDEDVATIEMVKESGVPEEVLFIVENWGFKNFTRIAESNNWNWKIAVYADHRIGPKGVVSLRENLENKQKRYKLSRPNASHISDQAEGLFNSALKIEQEIAENVAVDLKKIETPQVDGLIEAISNSVPFIKNLPKPGLS